MHDWSYELKLALSHRQRSTKGLESCPPPSSFHSRRDMVEAHPRAERESGERMAQWYSEGREEVSQSEWKVSCDFRAS